MTVAPSPSSLPQRNVQRESLGDIWPGLKRAVVEVLGPSGFSLLARAREKMGKTDVEFTVTELSELMFIMELTATPEQRQRLGPVFDRYTRQTSA